MESEGPLAVSPRARHYAIPNSLKLEVRLRGFGATAFAGWLAEPNDRLAEP
jgi:hypothetical protein